VHDLEVALQQAVNRRADGLAKKKPPGNPTGGRCARATFYTLLPAACRSRRSGRQLMPGAGGANDRFGSPSAKSRIEQDQPFAGCLR